MLCGAAGDDVIDGGAGNDTLDAEAGKDPGRRGNGDNTLRGADDSLFGNAGNDVLNGGPAVDTATAARHQYLLLL